MTMLLREFLFSAILLLGIHPTAADDKFDAFLHDKTTIERPSRGAYTHPDVYLWPKNIAAMIFAVDERKAGASRGYLAGVTRMSSIKLGTGSPINLVILTDRSMFSTFPFEEFRGTFIAGSILTNEYPASRN